MDKVFDCLRVILDTVSLFSPYVLTSMAIEPFISAMLNIHVNRLYQSKEPNIINCLLFKIAYDYISCIIHQNLFSANVRLMTMKLKIRMNLAKIRCGVSIPGFNLKQHKDLFEDIQKLHDFLFVLPILWSSSVNFTVSIFMMDVKSAYPVRLIFTIICIGMCCILTYLSDASLFENSNQNPKKITSLYDSEGVKLRIAMGAQIDDQSNILKTIKQQKQQQQQKYGMIIINIIIAYISLSTNNIAQLNSFGNISWMIGYLADNLKSIYYYTYMNEFLTLCKYMEANKLLTGNEIIQSVNRVVFKDVSFGYIKDKLSNNPTIDIIIRNLSFEFIAGYLYVIEAVNGKGKSSTLRAITQNIQAGDIYFNNTKRNRLTFECMRYSVFHLLQASEYMIKCSQDEIIQYKGKDLWLEEQLGLKNLFKDMVEMSGGQKKRMLLYIALVSDSSIILFDETFGEISVEETPDVPEGGGWLGRAIRTVENWDKRYTKIIIVVGHGLIDMFENKDKTIKLNLDNINGSTCLSNRLI